MASLFSNESTPNAPDLQDSLEDELTLALLPGIGPIIRQALIERFGSAQAVLKAAPSELQKVPGVGVKIARSVIDAHTLVDAKTEIATCAAEGIQILCERDDAYPRLLREIHNPPAVLFARGSLTAKDALAVAIVGTRHASTYGQQQAARLAAGLSRAGFTVVSGLARGIDAAAHRGTLSVEGRTIAVLGSGVLNVYPPEHNRLAQDICKFGVVISENAPQRPPISGTFPQRNRIITGMSLGVIVVEAAERSGALISARHAMEQGREVFAVPGRVDSRVSRGCHQLLRDGAKLVESVEDVLDELGPLVDLTPHESGRELRHPAELQLNEQECQVLDAIALEPTTIDEITQNSGLPVHRVLATISVLEMRHLIRRVSGISVVRC